MNTNCFSTTADQVNTTFGILKTTCDELQAKEGVVDKEISNHYHVLEMITMTAPQISKVTKGLRVLLKSRRDIKESLSVLTSVIAGYNDITARCIKQINKYEAEAKASFNRIMEVSK